MKKREFRLESDVLGNKRIPNSVDYGISTARAIDTFSSKKIINDDLLKAMLEIKIAAALANLKASKIDRRKASVIVKASKEVISNIEKYRNDFLIGTYQGGAGTAWHMNVNEVIANVALKKMGKRAGDYKIIDPHNDVNASQSTNDVIPTALRIACIKTTDKLVIEIERFISECKKKSKEFGNVLKSARTHLQDAVPITLGLEFDAWSSDISKRLKTIEYAKNNLKSLQIGGSAVGTGLNVPKDFDKNVVNNLSKRTKIKFSIAKNKIEETQFMSDFLDLSSSLRTLATDLTKISNDIRLLSSGPKTGLNEINLPKVGLGSSIMPNKFNPSMAEMLNMVCFQVMGNDEVVQKATEAGQLELNVMTPVLAQNLLDSIEILTYGIGRFTFKCLRGIKANQKQLKLYFENSTAIATVLSPIIGYDKTALLMKEAFTKNKNIKDLLIEKKILNNKEISKVFSRSNFKV